MSISRDRGIALELAVGLLLCGGAYYFVTRPIAEQAGATRARAESLVAQGYAAQGTGTAAPSAHALRQSAQEVAEAARLLHERGRAAFNEARVLTSLTALAAGHELQLEQIQPVPARTQRPSTPADPNLPTSPDDREMGYTFTLRGDYTRLIAFLRGFADEFPYTSIVNLRVSSTLEPNAPPVVAVVTTRHWVFDALPASRLADAAVGLPE